MELFKLFGTIAVKNSEANAAIDETTGKAEGSSNRISGAFKKIAGVVATSFAVSKIVEFGRGCLDAAANAEALNSQFSQVFGDLESTAASHLSNIADSAGMLETRVKGSYTQIAAFAKTAGMDTADSLSLADRAMVAVADSAAFYDRSLEETTDSLQSFLKGNYENDAALGLSATETTRNAAANALYGKSFNSLSEAQKQLTLLQMVEDANKLSGAMGQAARESDTWTNQTGNLKQAWNDFQAVIGSYVLEAAVGVIKKLAGGVQALTEKIQAVKTWVDAHSASLQAWGNVIKGAAVGVAALAAAWAGMNFLSWIGQGNSLIAMLRLMTAETYRGVAAKIADKAETLALTALYAKDAIAKGAAAIKTGVLTVATWAQNAAQAALNLVMAMNPIALVVIAIAALVAIFVTLWNKCEGFRNFWINLWENIKQVFSVVVDWFKERVEAVKEFFGGLGDKMSEVKETIVGKWNEMKENVSQKAEEIKNSITEKWDAARENTGKILDATKSYTQQRLNDMKASYEEHGGGIKGIAAAAMTGIKGTFTDGYNALNTLTHGKLGEVVSKVKAKMAEAKTAVANKLSEIKSSFSEKLASVKSTVTEKFNSIKTAITDKINAARDKVKSAIDKIKSFFKFSWSLPKLKLPHVTIRGKFSINPPSAPKFSISWYKKAMENAMILKQPTIFGAQNGKLLGGGEAGDEVVSGKNTLLGMIKNSVKEELSGTEYYLEKLNAMLANYLPEVLDKVGNDIVLDDGTLVGRLAPKMDRSLGDINKLRVRGR